MVFRKNTLKIPNIERQKSVTSVKLLPTITFLVNLLTSLKPSVKNDQSELLPQRHSPSTTSISEIRPYKPQKNRGHKVFSDFYAIILQFSQVLYAMFSATNPRPKYTYLRLKHCRFLSKSKNQKNLDRYVENPCIYLL